MQSVVNTIKSNSSRACKLSFYMENKLFATDIKSIFNIEINMMVFYHVTPSHGIGLMAMWV